MKLSPDRVYKALRIVESFGQIGCTCTELGQKLYPHTVDLRRNTQAAQQLRYLASIGLLVCVGPETGRRAKFANFTISAAGRQLLRAEHAAAARQAEARAAAAAAQLGELRSA